MSDRTALWSLLGVALVLSLVWDLRVRRIPNWVTYPTAALALAFRFYRHGLGDFDAENLGLLSGLASGAGVAAFLSIWAVRGEKIGWGDVKLVGAAACVFGYPLVLASLAF